MLGGRLRLIGEWEDVGAVIRGTGVMHILVCARRVRQRPRQSFCSGAVAADATRALACESRLRTRSGHRCCCRRSRTRSGRRCRCSRFCTRYGRHCYICSRSCTAPVTALPLRSPSYTPWPLLLLRLLSHHTRSGRRYRCGHARTGLFLEPLVVGLRIRVFRKSRWFSQDVPVRAHLHCFHAGL